MRSRLRRAFGMGGGPAPGPGVREYLRRRSERAAERRERVPLPEGVEVRNDRGACFVRTLHYAFDHVHGARQLGSARVVDWRQLAALARDDALAHSALGRCLFVDTETTGLAGGAGTVVFMTGLGFFDETGFRLEQVFLRSFEDEAAAMHHVAQRLGQRPLLVTFVGKAFDRHRLSARMTINRVEAPILTAEHFDLYYLARRAWGRELPDVRLRTVERCRLGVRRGDDLPGREAPHAFFEWLRDGTGPIDRVFEHNRLDVLSLVTLLAVLGE